MSDLVHMDAVDRLQSEHQHVCPNIFTTSSENRPKLECIDGNRTSVACNRQCNLGVCGCKNDQQIKYWIYIIAA